MVQDDSPSRCRAVRARAPLAVERLEARQLLSIGAAHVAATPLAHRVPVQTAPLVVTDGDGTMAQVQVIGPGSVTASQTPTGHVQALTLSGTTPASTLRIRVERDHPGADGKLSLMRITEGNGVTGLGAIDAPDAVVTNIENLGTQAAPPGISLAHGVRSLKLFAVESPGGFNLINRIDLGAVRGGTTIDLDHTDANQSAADFVEFKLAGPLNRFAARAIGTESTASGSTFLTAQNVQQVDIRGDANNALIASKTDIGTIQVGGHWDESGAFSGAGGIFTLNGHVGQIQVHGNFVGLGPQGVMTDVTALKGVNTFQVGGRLSQASIKAQGRIARIEVDHGIAPSTFVTDSIGQVHVRGDLTGGSFLAAHNIDAVSVQGNVDRSVVWSGINLGTQANPQVTFTPNTRIGSVSITGSKFVDSILAASYNPGIPSNLGASSSTPLNITFGDKDPNEVALAGGTIHVAHMPAPTVSDPKSPISGSTATGLNRVSGTALFAQIITGLQPGSGSHVPNRSRPTQGSKPGRSATAPGS